MNAPSTVVIAGASAAALSTAETLRRQGFDGRITMIGEEAHPPYDRPPLSKELLRGAWPDERVTLREPATIDGLDLDLRLGTRASSIDPVERRVGLSDGSRLDYDELVIATGARARRLPKTDHLAGLHVLRTLADAQQLRASLADRPRLVIVGAGFLGAEVASVARSIGSDVTLVSDLDAPLSDVLGRELGGLLIDLHQEHGVRVLTGVPVSEVLAEEGRATGIRLADGTVVDADLVLVSIGSIPNVDWLSDSPIKIGNGVVCDEFCSAGPGIWAAGDVASWYHRGFGEQLRIEHRTNATEQGMAVARNILAGSSPTPYEPVPYIWSDQYDRKIQIYGLPRGADNFAVTEGSLADRKLVSLYGKENRVRAAVGINMVRPIRAARALVATPTSWEDAMSVKEGATA